MTKKHAFLVRLQLAINQALGESGELVVVSIEGGAMDVYEVNGTIRGFCPITYTATACVEASAVMSGVVQTLAEEGVEIWADSRHSQFLTSDGRQQIVVAPWGRGGHIFCAIPIDPPLCDFGRPVRVLDVGRYEFFHNETKEVLAMGLA